MKRIKSFSDYLNENSVSAQLASTFSSLIGGVSGLSGSSTPPTTSTSSQNKPENQGSSSSSTTDQTNISSQEILKKTPGNDDYLIYLQHQQGPAGIKGIVKAIDGTGKLNKDTVATKMCKGNRTKYANLMCNVPSDVPKNVRQSIIDNLDKGDQKSAAITFANIWKGKFNRKYQEANKTIFEPKYKKIKEAIMAACIATGVPFDFAVTVAWIESSFNPNNGNKLYKGLYAMSPTKNYGGDIGVVGSKWADPFYNADKGVRLIKRDLMGLRKNLGSSWASLKMGDWTKKFVA
jgi:hypothetical protein